MFHGAAFLCVVKGETEAPNLGRGAESGGAGDQDSRNRFTSSAKSSVWRMPAIWPQSESMG